MWFKRRKKTDQDHALSESLRSLQSLLSESGRKEPSLAPREGEAPRAGPGDEETPTAEEPVSSAHRSPDAGPDPAPEPAVEESGNRWRDLSLSFDAELLAPRPKRSDDSEEAEAAGDTTAGPAEEEPGAGEVEPEAGHIELEVAGSEPEPAGIGPETADDGLEITGMEREPADIELETTAIEPETVDVELDTTDFEPETVDVELDTTDFEPETASKANELRPDPTPASPGASVAPPDAGTEPDSADGEAETDTTDAGAETNAPQRPAAASPVDEPGTADTVVQYGELSSFHAGIPANDTARAPRPEPVALQGNEPDLEIDLSDDGTIEDRHEDADADNRRDEDQLNLALGLEAASEDDIPTLTDVVYVPEPRESAEKPAPTADPHDAAPSTDPTPGRAPEPAAGPPHERTVERCIDGLRARLQRAELAPLSPGQEKALRDALSELLDDPERH